MAYYKSGTNSSPSLYPHCLSCNSGGPSISLAILILDSAMWHVLDIGMLEDLTMQESEKMLTQFHSPFIPQSPPGKCAGASLLETER